MSTFKEDIEMTYIIRIYFDGVIGERTFDKTEAESRILQMLDNGWTIKVVENNNTRKVWECK